MEFSCATPYGATVNLFTGSKLTVTFSHLPGGVMRSTLSFTATVIHNDITIVCTAAGKINGSTVVVDSPGVILLVQGTCNLIPMN